MNKSVSLVASSVLGSALTLGAVHFFNAGPQVVTLREAATPSSVQTVNMPNGLSNVPAPDFSATAERAIPAVVFIKNTEKATRGGAARGPQPGTNPFEEFFGGQGFFFEGPNKRNMPNVPRSSTGSGVIISADGYIVTNNHVIDGASEIEVTLNDNRTYKAKVIGSDPNFDLALVQIKANNLPHITFGNSDQVKVGNWVVAIGNPFNLSSTVTAGVVSAKSRNLRLLQGDAPIESFIQTDAAVNPGNSGGALLTAGGELIGINTAIQSPTGTFAGYSFAVPSNIVKKVVEDLIKYGVVQRGYLGILIRDVNADLAKDKNLDVYEGVYVDSLMANSAAKDAGLKTGDVITKIDGLPVRGEAALKEAIGRKRPGDKVALTVLRNKAEKVLTVSLKNKEGNTSTVEKASGDAMAQLGIDLAELSSSEANKLEVPGGVKVTKINGGIISQQTDMRQGFVITAVDKTPVRNIDELKKALKGKSGGVLLEGVYADWPGKYFYAFGLN